MPALLRRFERVGKRVREKATVLEDDLRHRRVGRRDRRDQRVPLALRAVLQEQPNDFGMMRLATHGGGGRPGERRGAVESIRSGERRGGEKGRSRGAPYHLKKKKTTR